MFLLQIFFGQAVEKGSPASLRSIAKGKLE
jgi:hypothetical protein